MRSVRSVLAWFGIVFIFVCSMFGCIASMAQEPEPQPDPPPYVAPAYLDHQEPDFTMKVNITDINATVARAESILVEKHGLTAEEAHQKILTNGQVDLARCVEFILLDTLGSIPGILTDYFYVYEIQIRLQHPLPAEPLRF